MFNKNKKLNNVHKEQEMTMPTTMEIKLLAVPHNILINSRK